MPIIKQFKGKPDHQYWLSVGQNRSLPHGASQWYVSWRYAYPSLHLGKMNHTSMVWYLSPGGRWRTYMDGKGGYASSQEKAMERIARMQEPPPGFYDVFERYVRDNGGSVERIADEEIIKLLNLQVFPRSSKLGFVMFGRWGRIYSYKSK